MTRRLTRFTETANHLILFETYRLAGKLSSHCPVTMFRANGFEQDDKFESANGLCQNSRAIALSQLCKKVWTFSSRRRAKRSGYVGGLRMSARGQEQGKERHHN